MCVQGKDLTGRDNRTGGQRKIDYTGTLLERRRQYEERREAQGQEQDRLTKQMRIEAGLEGKTDGVTSVDVDQVRLGCSHMLEI
jgi:hypothetical protein